MEPAVGRDVQPRREQEGQLTMILCIADEGLPGIYPCTLRGRHRVTCRDHEGWRPPRPGTCSGCLPREARHGFLCTGHHERVQDALGRWPSFRRALQGVDRTVTVDTAGVRGSSDGHTPFPQTFLAIDECESYLATLPDGPHGFQMWISSTDGARAALLFAAAAERAYRSHQVEEREKDLQRVRCPKCGQLALVRIAPTFRLDPVLVECGNCNHKIREGDEAHLYQHNAADGWHMVTADSIDVVDAIEEKSTTTKRRRT